MNFYFCEVCGKRLTEHDIEAGKGRDKKLNGVYCTSCAVGVTTMEMLPVTDDQIKDAMKKKATGANVLPQTGTGSGGSNKAMRPAGGSAVGIPSAAKGVRETRTVAKAQRSTTAAAPAKTATPMIVGAVVVIAISAGVIGFSLGGSKPTPKIEETAKTTRVSTPAQTPLAPAPTPNPPAASKKDDFAFASAPAAKNEPKSEKKETEPKTASDRVVDAETKAQQAYDVLMQTLDRLKDAKARIAAADEYLKDHGNTIVGSRVRVMQQRWKTELNAPSPPGAGTLVGKVIRQLNRHGGDWIDGAGKDGYVLFGAADEKGDIKKLPSYLSEVDIDTTNRNVWREKGGHRALEIPGGGRVAACAFHLKEFSLKVRFAKPQPARVSLYFLDFNLAERKGHVDLYAGDKLIDSATVSECNDGNWLQFDISGDVDIKIVSDVDRNMVLSGILFDPVPESKK